MYHGRDHVPPDNAVYAGLDCGGTHIRAALADAGGVILSESVWQTVELQSKDSGLAGAIDEVVTKILSSPLAAGRRCMGIGIGVPFVCHGGRVHLNRNVKSLDPHLLVTGLKERTGADVRLLNDVKCAAYGEAWRGVARGVDPFLFVNIGTGLAAALYADGQAYSGAHNAAGEIAYLTLAGIMEHGRGPAVSVQDGHVYSDLDDRTGPLEEVMSGVGLAGRYMMLSADGSGSRATGSASPGIDAREVFRRSTLGDPVAASVVESGFGELLAAIGNMLTFADPALLVIGGGVAGSLKPYKERIRDYLGQVVPFPPDIAWSELDGRAGLLGAIRLAMSRQSV